MAFDISSLSQSAVNISGITNLVLVTPKATVGYQPQNAPSFANDTSVQPPTIIFNFDGEQQVQFKADITDHYIENNTAIQDQIALKPAIVKTEGFVGELNNIAPPALKFAKELADKLSPLPGFSPQFTESAQIKYAEAFQQYQVAKNIQNSVVSTISTINGIFNGGGAENVINGSTQSLPRNPNQTQQQIYFSQFFGYFARKQLFTVQTPWALFQDMVIEEFTPIQSEETTSYSNFKLSFKQMRFASTLVQNRTLFDNSASQGRLKALSANEVDLGTSTLEQSAATFGSKLLALTGLGA